MRRLVIALAVVLAAALAGGGVAEFGGSPAARTRVRPAGSEGPKDELAEFLKRRPGGA